MNHVASYYVSRQKRLFDVVLAVIGIVISFPVFVVIGITVLLTAGPPIFFLQKRAGYHRKIFTMYKFRTMYLLAAADKQKLIKLNEAPEPMFKISKDPRFVGIGQWLSKTGLDELPQLFNILKGEMSFVGPRPLPLDEVQKLSPSWGFRFQTRPGVFSAWSVSNERHTSLKTWHKLEKVTLVKGNLLSDLNYISRTLFYHILTVLSRR